MQTAVATIPEVVDFPNFEIPQIRDLNKPRFFVQMVHDRLSVDTLSIPNRELMRAVIMPCISYKQILPLFEIREADLIPGSETNDNEGKRRYGKIWRYGQDEADRLVELEKTTEHKTGLVEITDLQRLPELYRKKINVIFLGGRDAEQCETKALGVQIKHYIGLFGGSTASTAPQKRVGLTPSRTLRPGEPPRLNPDGKTSDRWMDWMISGLSRKTA
jgi:hypothetical protein